jgi:hypothetical protein
MPKYLKLFDKNILQQCQFFMGYIPFQNILDQARITYLLKLKNSSVGAASFLFEVIDQHELIALLTKYIITNRPNLSATICKHIISEQFRLSVLSFL